MIMQRKTIYTCAGSPRDVIAWIVVVDVIAWIGVIVVRAVKATRNKKDVKP